MRPPTIARETDVKELVIVETQATYALQIDICPTTPQSRQLALTRRVLCKWSSAKYEFTWVMRRGNLRRLGDFQTRAGEETTLDAFGSKPDANRRDLVSSTTLSYAK
jgi:hypothetical protein